MWTDDRWWTYNRWAEGPVSRLYLKQNWMLHAFPPQTASNVSAESPSTQSLFLELASQKRVSLVCVFVCVCACTCVCMNVRVCVGEGESDRWRNQRWEYCESEHEWPRTKHSGNKLIERNLQFSQNCHILVLPEELLSSLDHNKLWDLWIYQADYSSFDFKGTHTSCVQSARGLCSFTRGAVNKITMAMHADRNLQRSPWNCKLRLMCKLQVPFI